MIYSKKYLRADAFLHDCTDETINECAQFINSNIKIQKASLKKVKIIDLGIGTGFVSLKLAKKLSQIFSHSIEWYGVDIVKDLSYLKGKLKQEGATFFKKNGWEVFKFPLNKKQYNMLTFFLKENFDLERSDMEELKQEFNIVYAPWFFHHLIEWKKVLTKVYEILKDDGYLIIQFSGGIFKGYDGDISSINHKNKAETPVKYWKAFWGEIISAIRYNWIEQTDISANNYSLLFEHLEEFGHLWERVSKGGEKKVIEFDFDAQIQDYENLIDSHRTSPLRALRYLCGTKEDFKLFINRAKVNAREVLKGNGETFTEKRSWKIEIFKKKKYKESDWDFKFYNIPYDASLKEVPGNLDEREKKRIIQNHSLRAIKDFNRPILLPVSDISRSEILNAVLTARFINILFRENLIPQNDLLFGVTNVKLDGKFAINFFAHKDNPEIFKALSFIEYWINYEQESFSKYIIQKKDKNDLHIIFNEIYESELKNLKKHVVLYYNDIGAENFKTLNIDYETRLRFNKNRSDLLPKSYYTLFEEYKNYDEQIDYYRKWETIILEKKEIEKEDEKTLFRTYLVNYANFLLQKCHKLPVIWNYTSKIVLAYGLEDKNCDTELIGTGAFMLATERPLADILQDNLKTILDVFYSKMSIWKWKEITQIEMRRKGIRAAVAAIMARNMSHNIGSHVLNNLADPDITDSFVKRLMELTTKKNDYRSCVRLKDFLFSKFQEYLRERMDLVAAIPTNAPIWSLSLEAKKDITDRLSEILDFSVDAYNIPILSKVEISGLFLLFDNIVHSEGIKAEKLQFIPRFYEHNKKPKIKEDLKASIYGGVLGTQCFYIILENFIRNSAKFGSNDALGKIKTKENPEKLIIYIDFYENWDNDKNYQEDFIKVELYDNLGGWPSKKKTKKGIIEEKIEDVISPKLDTLDPEGSLIDEEGKIREGNWGSKEMRIAASYIRGIPIEEIETPISGEPDIIKAFPVEDQSRENFKTLGGKASLGYRFFLKKPKNILIISNREDIKNVCSPYQDFKADGIEIVSYNEFETKISKFTHEFFVLDFRDDEGMKLYGGKNLLFPIKTLFIYDAHHEEDIENKLKKYFRKEEIISKFIMTFDEIDTNQCLVELVNKSNLGQKESVKNLYINLSKKDKFKFNILVKWNEIFAVENFKVSVSIYSTGRKKCLTEGKYNLNLLHPPISDFSNSGKDYRNEIKNSNYLGFFSNGIHNIFLFFKNAFSELNKKNFDVKKFDLIMKALAMASYNIVMIDERIFKSHQQLKSITKGKFKIGNFWYMQNVAFYNMEKDEKGDIVISYYLFDWEDQWNNDSLKKKVDPISKKANEIKFEEILPSWFKGNVHFMIVHIGIIDKIGGKENFEGWLKELQPEFRPWFLLIDSGRGHPEGTKIPGNTRFQDFSNLRKYIIEEPDKYILSNVILNARE